MNRAHHFDVESLQVLVQLMGEDFPELVEVFVLDSETRIVALKQAIALKDTESLREISHSFKGACANLAALPLAELCFKVETLARDGKIEKIVDADIVAKIEQEYLLVNSILQSMI